MLRAILNKSWGQCPTKHQLSSHIPTITKTIQVRRTRHAGHCWRSRSELISEVLLWTPSYGRAKAGRPARTYIQQLCEDTRCSPEDLPEVMNDREKWRKRFRDIRAGGTTLLLLLLLFTFLALLLVSHRPLSGLYPRSRMREGTDYIHSMNMFRLLLLGFYLSTHINTTLPRR